MKFKLSIQESVTKNYNGDAIIFKDEKRALLVLGKAGESKSIFIRDKSEYSGAIIIDLDDTMVKDLIASLKK